MWQWLFGPWENVPQWSRQESASAPESPAEVLRQQSCNWPPWGGVSQIFGDSWTEQSWIQVLAGVLRRCNMDLREFQRVLVRTEAYQRAARVTPAERQMVPVAPIIRRLPAEVVWDALVSWLPAGHKESRSVDLPQVPDASHALRLLGRGSREWADESLPTISFAVARFFQTDSRVEQAAAELAMRATGAAGLNGPERQVEGLFLTILGRAPDAEEMRSALLVTASSGLDALAWCLLNSPGFLFQL